MCLILFAYHFHPDYPLIVLANRDEFYQRPSEAAHFWTQAPQLLAGKDLQAGGTWLGYTRGGRFAAITNFRHAEPSEGIKSRGFLTLDFLLAQSKPKHYLQSLCQQGKEYNAFNLLVGDQQSLYYYSNRQDRIRELAPGVYGLSNHLLDTAWPKVEAGRNQLFEVLQNSISKRSVANEPNALQTELLQVEHLLPILLDTHCVPDDELPNTGVGIEIERLLAPLFIRSEHYGTRSSCVLLLDKQGKVQFHEQNFDANGPLGSLNRFAFKLNP